MCEGKAGSVAGVDRPVAFWPLRVTLPDGTDVPLAKVTAWPDGSFDVWRWDGRPPDGQPVLVHHDPGPFAQRNTARRRWSAPSGLEAAHVGHCGCGHPLERFTPEAPGGG